MNNRYMILSMVVGFSLFLSGCASTPKDNQMVDEAKAAYEDIRTDPDVARSGDRQLRSARDQLARAERLLEEGASTAEIEHAAYMANRHAEIAREQAERAKLQQQINSAEERRKELALQAAQQEAAEMRRQMEAMQAEQTDRGMVLTLGDVLFDLNRAELKPAGETTVGRLADFMAQYENRRVRVEGYTDSTGAESYNQQLSERRAEAVREALMDRGISRARIEVQGFGEQYPVATNETSAGRQQNRRVEIVISDADGNIKER